MRGNPSTSSPAAARPAARLDAVPSPAWPGVATRRLGDLPFDWAWHFLDSVFHNETVDTFAIDTKPCHVGSAVVEIMPGSRTAHLALRHARAVDFKPSHVIGGVVGALLKVNHREIERVDVCAIDHIARLRCGC